MDRKTTELQVAAAVGVTLPAATVIGISLWIFHRIESVIAAQKAFEASLDRRLRSLEESAARAEAEVRFAADRLGNPISPRPTLTELQQADTRTTHRQSPGREAAS